MNGFDIPGLTWREMKEVWTQGVRSYLKDVFNLIDCLQITLYWISILTGALAYNVSCYDHFQLFQ